MKTKNIILSVAGVAILFIGSYYGYKAYLINKITKAWQSNPIMDGDISSIKPKLWKLTITQLGDIADGKTVYVNGVDYHI